MARVGAVVINRSQDSSSPIGAVTAFSGAAAPDGWLLCQGQAVSRATYASLFAAIGITHGQGDGSTTFNLPDYRGRFLRGQANGSANDPDRASRTAMATGGATGDNVGSVQGNQMSTHRHETAMGFDNNGVFFHAGADNNPVHGSNVSSPVRGASIAKGANADGFAVRTMRTSNEISPTNETRPINAYVNYIIKV
jgi:microcystin-dependent protein